MIYSDLRVITAPPALFDVIERDGEGLHRAPLEEHKHASANLYGERDGVIILKQACARGCDARD